jgi:hypothetical protein
VNHRHHRTLLINAIGVDLKGDPASTKAVKAMESILNDCIKKGVILVKVSLILSDRIHTLTRTDLVISSISNSLSQSHKNEYNQSVSYNKIKCGCGVQWPDL